MPPAEVQQPLNVNIYQWLLNFSAKWKTFGSANYVYFPKPSLENVDLYAPLLMPPVIALPNI